MKKNLPPQVKLCFLPKKPFLKNNKKILLDVGCWYVNVNATGFLFRLRILLSLFPSRLRYRKAFGSVIDMELFSLQD